MTGTATSSETSDGVLSVRGRCCVNKEPVEFGSVEFLG
jgi:hypothetical protein